jgi:hypothetical protein
MAGRFLKNNYKQALNVVNENTKELDVHRAAFPDEHFDFEQWKVEEFQYLQAVASEPLPDAQTVQYVEALERLRKYECVYLSYFFTQLSQLNMTGKIAMGIPQMLLLHTHRTPSHRARGSTLPLLRQPSKNTQHGVEQSDAC